MAQRLQIASLNLCDGPAPGGDKSFQGLVVEDDGQAVRCLSYVTLDGVAHRDSGFEGGPSVFGEAALGAVQAAVCDGAEKNTVEHRISAISKWQRS
jgi:hypothetical protein